MRQPFTAKFLIDVMVKTEELMEPIDSSDSQDDLGVTCHLRLHDLRLLVFQETLCNTLGAESFYMVTICCGLALPTKLEVNQEQHQVARDHR